jgi:hypothetical protein
MRRSGALPASMRKPSGNARRVLVLTDRMVKGCNSSGSLCSKYYLDRPARTLIPGDGDIFEIKVSLL